VIDLAYAAASAPGGGPAGTLSAIVPLVLMFAVFYFLLIRPQQKQKREKERMLANLKRGDKVVTQGGLLGTVMGFTDTIVTLRIADQVRVECLRSSVVGLQAAEGEQKDKRDTGS
jgi:preprotein translocase subunit YajC